MMNDQYSREEWLAFLTSLGTDENDLEKLVENQQKANEFFQNLESDLATDLSESLDIRLPAGYRIGKYAITHEIGKGGMAQVYKANRADGLFDQAVAIKLLSPVLSSRQYESYFNSERKLLASLSHPNIARIIDGGVTDEIPYFIMEYIEGVPVDEYCQQKNLNSQQILEIVVEVCLALQHAHNQFVLHRDIKPSNILISSEGNIKLLDFGIGKFLDETDEQHFSFGGTLKYASPEQVSQGTLTTQSDIYQVGVLLYKLLTGTVPFEGEDRGRIISDIKQGKYVDAKTRTPRISRDLNAIISKCMAQKSSERYTSLTAVISDIYNHLNHYPVSARDLKWRYVTGLFLKRNAITSSLVTLVLLISVGAAVFTRIQMTKTEKERQKVVAANKFLTRIFEANDPNIVQGEEVSAAMLLRNSENEIGNIQDPEIKAFTQSQLGKLYESIGLWEEAGALFFNVLDYYQGNDPEQNYLEIADVYNHLAGYYRNISEFEKADSTIRIAIKVLEKTRDQYPVTLAVSYQDHAHLLYQTGNYQEGERRIKKAIGLIEQAIAKGLPDERYPMKKEIELAFAYNTLSSLLREQSRYDEALEVSKKAVDIGKKYADENISVKLIPLNNLALAYNRLGQHDREIRILKEKLKEQLEIYGNENPTTIITFANLGAAYYKAGNYEKSDSLNQLAYEAYLQRFGPYHNYTVSTLYNLANSKYTQERFAEAHGYFQKVLKADLENFGADHPYVAGDFVSLGLVEKALQNHSPAEKYFKDAFHIYFDKFGENHQKVSYVHSLLGNLYGDAGNLQKAQYHYQKAISISEKVLGTDHRYYRKYVKEWEDLKSRQTATLTP